jgi:UDP-glucuronate 4-epimerase
LLIDVLEAELGIPANREYDDMQPGDVKETFADVSSLERAIGYSPSTPIDKGLAEFVRWYERHHRAEFL